MVLEAVVVSILKKYIGKYIKNFDGKNLSLSLWSGEATLCDLELKAEALAELDLPIQVTSGFIGKLFLSIPWSSLYTQSVVLNIDNVFVVASPQIESPFDAEQNKKFHCIMKQNQLNFITNLKEKEKEKLVDITNDTLMEKLTAQIIKNIQILISNIHVRYEDKTSNPLSPFAFGVTLNELSVQTTDENWLPSIVDGSAHIIFKMIKATNVSVYWNTNITQFANGQPYWKRFMKNHINIADKINPQEFIIKPLLIAIELKIDQDLDSSLGLPKFLLDVVLKEISIEITKNQFESMINLIETFERMAINSVYRKYKPIVSVKENPKLWWKYIFESYVEISYKCWTWERIKQHRGNYRSYVAFYKEKLKDQYLHLNRKTVYENCEKTEELLDVANILIARKQAENEFNIEKENGAFDLEEKSEQPLSWLEWLGISSRPNSLQDKKIIEKASMLSLAGFSEKEKNDLYHAIGYTKDREHPAYSKEYVRSQISLHLETSSVNLKDEAKRSVLNFEITKLICKLTERPGSHGYGVDFSLEDLHLESNLNNANLIIANSERILWCNFQINPVDVKADYSVTVSMEPLSIIYDEKAINSVKDFFVISNQSKFQELSNIATGSIKEITVASRAGIEFAVDHNKVLFIDINMKCPILIFPVEWNSIERIPKLLHLNLGILKVITNLNSDRRALSVKNATDNELETIFYYQTEVNLTNIHVAVQNKLSFPVEVVCSEEQEKDFVLSPTSINVQIHRSLKFGYANYPDIKMYCTMSDLQVYLSDEKYFLINQTFDNLVKIFVNTRSLKPELDSSSGFTKANLTPTKNGVLYQEKIFLQNALIDNEPLSPVSSSDEFFDAIDAPILNDFRFSHLSHTKFIANFTIENLAINYEMRFEGFTKSLSVMLKWITCDTKVNKWDTLIKTTIKSLKLVQVMEDERKVFLLSLNKQEELFQVKYKQADPKGPEFQSKFNKNENLISVYIGMIKLNVMEADILDLVKYFINLNKRIKTENKSSNQSSVSSKNVEVDSIKTLKKAESDTIKIDFKYEFALAGIELLVHDLFTLKLTDLDASVAMSFYFTKFSIKLKDVSFTDECKETKYSKILSVTTFKTWFYCEIVFNSNIEKESIDPDLKIILQVGKVKIFIIPEFLTQLLESVNKFKKSINYSSNATTAAPKSITNKSLKIQLIMSLDAPDIYVPISRLSSSCFMIALGRIDISTSVYKDKIFFYEKLQIDVNDFKFLRNLEEIIFPLSIQIECERSLNKPYQDIKIKIHLAIISVKIHNDVLNDGFLFLNIFGILKSNSADNECLVLNSTTAKSSLLIHADVNEVLVIINTLIERPLLTVCLQKLTLVSENCADAKKSHFTFKHIEIKSYDNEKTKILLNSFFDGGNMNAIYYDTTDKNQDLNISLGHILLFLDDCAIRNIILYTKPHIKSFYNMFTIPGEIDNICFENKVSNQIETHLNIHATVISLSMTWCCSDICLAVTRMNDIVLMGFLTEKITSFKLRLNSFCIEDLSHESLYNQVFIMLDDNALVLEYLASEVTTDSVIQKQITLSLKVGRVKFIYLYKFVKDVMFYFDCLMKPMTSLYNNEKDKFKETSITYFQLHIEIVSSLVVYPETSVSNKYLLANFDRCVIKNSPLILVNNFTVEISEMSLSMVDKTSVSKVADQLNPCLQIVQSVLPQDQSRLTPVQNLKIDVHINPIIVHLNEKHIQLFMCMFQANFFEKGETQKRLISAIIKSNQVEGTDSVDVNIKCELIKFIVSSNVLFKEKYISEQVNICELCCPKFTLKVFVDDKVSVKLALKEIIVTDLRPYSNFFFKKMFEQFSEEKLTPENKDLSEEKNKFSVIYNCDAKEGSTQYYKFKVKGGTLLINVDFIRDIIKYYIYVITLPPDYVYFDTNELFQIRVTFEFPDLKLVLLQDSFCETSNAVVIKLQSRVSYEQYKEKMSIELTDGLFGIVLKQYPLKNKQNLLLLQPSSVTAKISLTNAMEIDVLIKKMVFCLSPSIVTAIIYIVDGFVGYKILEKKESLSSTKINTKVNWSPQLLNKDFLQEQSYIAPQNDFQTGLQKFQLMLDALELTLGNDLKGVVVPLIKFNICTSTKILDWSTRVSFDIDFTIEASLFNDELATWEPVIEPDNNQNDSFEVNIRSFYCENKKLNLSKTFVQIKSEKIEEYDQVDTKDFKRDIMHFIISSDNILQLTITSKFLKVASLVSEGFSIKSLRNPVKTELVAPYHFDNQLGVNISIWVDKTLKASVGNSSIQVLKRSNNLTVGIETRSLSTYHLIKKSPSVRSRSSRMLNRIFSKTDENSESFIDFIDIQVSGFNLIKNFSLSAVGCYGYKLTSTKSGTSYEILIDVSILNGRRFITFSSVIQIVNYLPMGVHILSVSGQELCFTEKRSSIPLEYSLIDEIKVSLERNFMSEKLISIKNIEDTEKNIVIKCSLNENVKYVNVVTKSELNNNISKKLIILAPPAVILNFLPRKVIIYIQWKNTKGPKYLIESGSMLEIMDTNICKKAWQIAIKYCDDYDTWIGSTSTKITQRNFIEMNCLDKLRSSLMFEMRVELVDGTLKIRLFTTYWLVNKTGINLLFKNSKGDLYNILSNNMFPTIISYSEQKNEGNLSLNGGSWSDSFYLNVVSNESVIKCIDNLQNEYRILLTVNLSSFGLTYIIKFSPTHLICNNTELTLLFSNDLPHPQWKILNRTECLPVWSLSSLLLLKEENGAHLSQAIPFDCNFKCVKRLSSSETVCVNVDKLGEKFVMKISPYEDGCIPLRVDNYCHSISIFVKQKDTTSLFSTHEFLPNHSQYFTWNDLKKPYEVLVSSDPHCKSSFVHINPIQNTFGKLESFTANNMEEKSQSSSCCTFDCFPRHGDKHSFLMSSYLTYSVPDIYWVSFYDGLQRVLAFTTDFNIARKLYKIGNEESITMEVFVSIHGIGLSLVNSIPLEIAYISITGGTSKWEVNSGKGWNVLEIVTSTLLEESWNNDCISVNIKNKIKADFEAMVIKFPFSGTLRRTQEPGLWLHVIQSKQYLSFHVFIQRLQVDNQQYGVVFPAVLYPTPLPQYILKRKGIKPFLEASVVFGFLNNSVIIRYLKVLLQEINLKLDRDIITGIMSFSNIDKTNKNEITLLVDDMKVVQKSEEQAVIELLGSHSSNLVLNYFHLSPIKIHLSFSIESRKVDTNINLALLEWLVSTIGIHFTDVSDIVIKLAFFECKNVSFPREVLVAEINKHYLIQAAKQFHILVLGLDVIGNPYGLISDYGEGLKDFFYEPYLGSVEGQFAEGLAYGVKSLLGHTVGGTIAAASLITEQFGQVVAAMSFDSEYKKKRKARMQVNQSCVGQEFIIGGKQFLFGILFGISGLVTKPVQGARASGINGFFKGFGKGIIGLLVKPASGVVDLVTSSLDGIKRFSEQVGKDVVCRVRLPRVTVPNQPVVIYSNEHSYGYGLLKSLSIKKKIDFSYKDYVVISDEPLRFVFFTTENLISANQKNFFDDWDISFILKYKVIESVEQKESTVFLLSKLNSVEMESEIFQEIEHISCKTPVIAKILVEKITYYTTATA
ncbi:intermembrane lipid transfer protein VPS13A isoform X3 [Hydra vulgaris]|uniref:intermembrane lipid transfer protein VPS13A isoform X3 n=1 Tax=Hydra vulgaris TaxID=6087 RepID=UPI0032EA0B0D